MKNLRMQGRLFQVYQVIKWIRNTKYSEASFTFSFSHNTMAKGNGKLNGTDLIHGDSAVEGLGAEVSPSISVTTSAYLNIGLCLLRVLSGCVNFSLSQPFEHQIPRSLGLRQFLTLTFAIHRGMCTLDTPNKSARALNIS